MKIAGGVLAATMAVQLGVASAPAGAAAEAPVSALGAAAGATVPAAAPQLSTTGVVTFSSAAPAAIVGGPTYQPAAGTTNSGPVSFSIDQATTNSACSLNAGVVSFDHAGTCVIDATVPADAGHTAASSSQTFTVSPASTTVSLVVGSSTLTATVVAAAPGSGTPTGTVAFTVGGRALGSSSLVAGVATLDYSVPPNVTEAILATYQGDGDYTASDATVTANGPDIEPTFVARPTIAARLTSAEPKNRRGWWHTAVRVTFICNGAGSSIVGGCPRAMLLQHSGADLTVTRTIRTVAGDSATVALRGIKLDLTRPRVKIVGVRDHALYRGSRPRVSCVASDPVSGIKSCRVTTTVTRNSAGATVTYTATATSWAGVTRHTSEIVYSKR